MIDGNEVIIRLVNAVKLYRVRHDGVQSSPLPYGEVMAVAERPAMIVRLAASGRDNFRACVGCRHRGNSPHSRAKLGIPQGSVRKPARTDIEVDADHAQRLSPRIIKSLAVAGN